MRKLKTFGGLCLTVAVMAVKAIPYVIAIIVASLWAMLHTERDPGWK